MDKRISQFPAKVTPVGADYFPLVDSEDADPTTQNKSVTLAQIAAFVSPGGDSLYTANGIIEGTPGTNRQVGGNGNSLTFGTTADRLVLFNVNTSNNQTFNAEVPGFATSQVQVSPFGAFFTSTNIPTGEQYGFFAVNIGSQVGFNYNNLGQNTTIEITPSGIGLTDDNGDGMFYTSDIFLGSLPTNLEVVPSTRLMTSFLGTTTMSALAITPTPAEDGYVFSYDDASGEILLVPQGGGGGGLTGSGSGLSDDGTTVSLGGPITAATTFDGGGAANVIWGLPTPLNSWLIDTPVWQWQTSGGIFSLSGNNVSLQTGAADVTFSTGSNGFGTTYDMDLMDGSGMGFYTNYNQPYPGGSVDRAGVRMPQNNYTAFEIFNFFSQEIGTAQVFASFYGGITTLGHKNSASNAPGPINVDDDYIWASLQASRQFVVGGLFGGANGNANLVVKSQPTSSSLRPHMQFIGAYDATLNGSQDGNQWLDTDGAIYVRNNATNYRLDIDPVTIDLVTEGIVQANWSGNTTYQYSVTVADALPGDFCEVIPNENVMANLNAANSEYNGYAYCVVAGTVIVVNRVTSFISVSGEDFDVRIIK